MGHKATSLDQSPKSKMLVYGILIFQIALIVSLVGGLKLSLKSRERVDQLNEQKQKLEQENISLKKESDYVQSDYYVEKVAREELQLSRPGETVVILPDGDNLSLESKETRNTADLPLKNWQKWWKLIMGRSIQY